MNLRGKSYPSTVVWWYLFGKCWANDNVDIINLCIFSSDFRGRATTSRALERTPSRWCWFHTSSWFWLMDTMQSLQAAMLEMNACQLPVSQIRPLAPPFYPRGKLGTPMLAFGFSLHAAVDWPIGDTPGVPGTGTPRGCRRNNSIARIRYLWDCYSPTEWANKTNRTVYDKLNCTSLLRAHRIMVIPGKWLK